MRCEVISVGTELLLGQTVDTNSTWIGEQLAGAGIDCHHQSKVGDNMERIIETLRRALERSDAVIVCGGLGPTQDDITRDAIAVLMDAALKRDATLVERIRARFRSRDRDMPANNLRQADVPEGAHTIAEMPGTAPGLICPIGDKVLYAVPGVPSEMRAMVSGTILGDLRRRSGETAVIRSRILRTWGHSESALAELLSDRIRELDAVGNPTLAFMASGVEGLKVRITVKTADEAQAAAMLDDEGSRLRAILGDIVFGLDDQNMEAAVVARMRDLGLGLGVAESFTGGLLAARLTAAPNADQVLRGAVVAGARHGSGGGAMALLAWPQAASENTAIALAHGVAELTGAEVGIAACADEPDTDAAEQSSLAVFLAVLIQGTEKSTTIRLPADADRLRPFSVISLLNLLRLALRSPA